MIGRGLIGAVGLLFIAAGWVQLNDTDSVPWVAIYGAAGLASLCGGIWTAPRGALAIGGFALALIAVVWAGTILPVALRDASWTGETAREIGGLTILGLWSAGLAAAWWPRKPPS